MKDYNRAENKVLKPDAARISADKSAYSPAKSKASGASETGSSAKLGGRGSSGNKSRHHRYGGFKGTALVVLLTFSMVFASVLGAFADDLTNTVPNNEANPFYNVNNEGKGIINTGFGPNGHTPPSPMYGPGFGPHTVDGVVQSQSTQSPTSFAAGLPLGTIFIDQTKVPEYGGVTEVVSKDNEIIAGLVLNCEGLNYTGYDGTRPGAIKLVPNKINKLNGPLFKVTFADAAVLPNGDRADLVITYSDAQIVIDERYMAAPLEEQYYHGAAYLARGNAFSRGGSDNTDMRNYSGAVSRVNSTAQNFNDGYTSGNAGDKNRTPVTGVTMDATYQIVNKDGTPAAGTFVFAVCGINLDRDPDVRGGNNVAKPLWYSFDENFGGVVNPTTGKKEGGANGKDHSFFSEALEIVSGQESDYVYVRPNTSQEDNSAGISGLRGQYFYPNVSIHNDNIKFISNSSNSPGLSGHDNSYSAGFVTLADAATGFKVRGTGHGNSLQGMNSAVFNSKQIWYRYTSSTGPNGNIQITSEGNFSGKLEDGGDILGPGTYVVAEGKTVTYTMTPDYGYKIRELKLNGNEVLFDTKKVSKMKKGDSLETTTAAGNKATLVYDYDGTYSFKFEYANKDEAVHVEWEPTTADILAHKAWSDSDDKDGMRKGTDGTADWPKLKLQYSTDGGVNWDDVTENYYGEDIDRQDVPTGKDTTGKYKDGIYAVGTDTTTGNGNAKHPYTWEYLPIYEYDSNGKTAGEILYRIVEGTEAELNNSTYSGNNPALEGYHTPDYRDVQQFNLLSNETKTKDGLQIYKGTDGKQYVRKADNKYYPVTNWVAGTTAVDPPTGTMTPLKTGDLKKIDIGGNEYQVQINKSNNPKYRNQEFVLIGTNWYRIVYNEKSDVVVKVPTDPDELADFSNMADSTLNGFNTADKADPYKSVAVRNEHNVSDIDVEVTKEWNDAYLYDAAAHEPIKPEGGVPADNEYDRKDITFVLHGTINNGGTVVDLTPEDDTTTDLEITLSKDELNSRALTANSATVYRDKTDGKLYTRTGEGTAASPYTYYDVIAVDNKNTSTTGNSSDTPAATQPKDDNMEEALNSDGYKVDGSNYGVIFEGLQAYHDGQLIEYTVTEKMDKADSFTVTGGTIEEVKDSGNIVGFKMSDLDEVKENQDLLGYKANFTNTPIIDDKYNTLPIKIKKLDSYTGQPLANAEFTVYADPAIDLEPRTSTYKQIDGLTVFADASDNQYVKKTDGNYYVVTGDTIGAKANPQPTASDLNKVKNTNYKKIYEGDTDRTGLEVWTDKKGHEYVLKNNEYYAVDPDGNIASRKADPQPTANTLSKIEVPGEVDEIVVVTDANGEAIVNINRSGIYTIEETKAPDGYTGDTKSYQFDASTELRKVVYMDPDGNHSTHWWERLYELIFGPRTNTEKNWQQTDNKTGELTVKDDPLTAHVLVRKIWDDNTDQDGVRPKDSEPAKLPEMTLQYTIKDPAEATESDWKTAQVYDPERETEGQPDPGLVDVDTKKTSYAGGAIHKDNNNAYTWIDLPAYRDGKVVYYRIKETGTVLTDGTYRITKNETVATGDENFNLVDANKKSTNQIVEVTNTHTPQVLTIHATKRWLDNSNELQHRPETLKITLYKEVDNQESTVHELNLDGRADDPATGKAYEVASTEEGDTWNAIFKDLPAFENGAPIKYRLEETLSDGAQTWYVNSYYVTYTDTEDRSINDGLDFVVANDVKRTFVDEEETKKVGDTTYTVYKEGGNKYVRTGEGTDESPYTYYLIADDGTVDMDAPADPQPTSPVVSIVKKETTDATLKVENFSKNNFETYKYWIGGANANVRYQLYRSTDPDDMETKESTANPIKTGDQITVTSGDITGTFDVYNHANGKKYVDTNTDPNVQTPKWHEIQGDGTTTPYTIDSAEATINITTWTPYDMDEQGNPKYVNVNDPDDVKTKSEYDALPDDEKDLYEYKVRDNWEKVTDGPDRGEHLFVSSAFKTDMKLPGDDEEHPFENLPAVDSNSRPYTYRVFETTTAGSWTDARFEGHYTYDSATKKFTITNINKMVEEGSSDIDVLKDLSGREWDAKFNKTGKEADKDVFYFWIEPIKGVDPDTGEIIEFGDSAEDQAAKAKVPLPGDGNQYGRALSRNTAVGTTAREVSFSPILYGPTDIPEGQSSETFYYKVYESKDANGTIVTQKDDKGITYDGTTENNVWKPKTEVMKVVATADANNVVTASHSWEKVTKNTEAGTTTVDWTTETPIFKNTYSSEGVAKAWIEKNIQSREWKNYSKSLIGGDQTGDAFQFTITSIAGANLNTEGATPDDSYVTMPLVTASTHKNPQHDLQQLTNSMWAFGVNGNPYSGELLGKKGEAYFIYEITENGAATSTDRDDLGASNYTVDGLTYDDSKIFAKVKVTDNWDGTLSFDVHYYSDASCKEGTEITQHKAWIVDKLLIESYVSKSDPTDTKTVEQYNALSEAEKAKYEAVYSYVNKSNPEDTKTSSEYAAITDPKVKAQYTNNLKRLLSTTEAEAAKSMPVDQQKAAGYREVSIAHFDNRETVDIPVKKQWIDGPAVEDVTLHLERHLFPLDNEAQLDGGNGVSFVEEKAKPANWNPENYINKTNYSNVISKTEYEGLTPENKAKYEECGDFWQKLGYVHDVDRGDFLKQNGDPKYDLLPIGSKTSTKLIENEEGFNKDLPKYVVRYGVTYRAVYRLVEDDTSDAYTREYDPQYYINDSSLGTEGALVVKNTVVAQNTANIAAVKQFLGRKWLEADRFEFELLPYGVAQYNDKDEITGIDTSDAGKAKVPMPATDPSLDSKTITKGYINKADASDKKTEAQYSALPDKAKNNYGPNADGKYVNKDDPDDIIEADAYNALDDGPSKQDYVAQQESTTSAVIGNTTVDPNGTLERLARFGAITYTTSDLEYDKTDRHMQGDFYYIMREKMPTIVTEGDNQLYPVEYTVVKGEGTSATTETREVTDKTKLPTAGTDEKIKSIKFSNGITYDCDEHTVHVKVRENRTKDLQVQVAYDYTKRDDIASGTQFTPVVTNRYDAFTDVSVELNKYIMGRDWIDGETFDFTMTPLAGAPFEDTNKATDEEASEDFPKKGEDSGTVDHVKAALASGKAAHTDQGGHAKRMTVTDTTAVSQNLKMPAIRITYSELGKSVAAGETVKDKDGNSLAEGTAYDRFMYALSETEKYGSASGTLNIDPDTEYVQVTVYDKGDGTLDYYTEMFEDRYGKVKRYEPGPDGKPDPSKPAKVGIFVNQLKRDLSVMKAWAGTATEDVTLKLQWSTNGTNFWDVEGTNWFANIEGTKVIPKGAKGDELTATWQNLPAYANITNDNDRTGTSGNDYDLDDKWIYYQVVEVTPSGAEVRYNKTPYVPGETKDDSKYSTDPHHTGEEKDSETGKYIEPDKRVKKLHVTNFPKNIKKEASFGVVKQYIGKNWTNEVFNFEATPVKSKIGSESNYVAEGGTRKIVNYVHKETGAVISEQDYEALTPEEQEKYEKHERDVANALPKFKDNNNKAKADTGTDKVSVNEHAANFGSVVINRSDLAFNPTTGKMEGYFVYKIKEVVPTGAVEIDEVCGKDIDKNDVKYKVAKDDKGNNIKYTTEEHVVVIFAEDNGEEIHTSISFDERSAGEFVPVYTNYGLRPTPIEGTKTWIGGEPSDHKNGTVEIQKGSNGNSNEDKVTDSTDKLELIIKRKLNKDGASEETLERDDANRPLKVVWAKRTPHETQEKDGYEPTTDTDVDEGKDYYTHDGDEYNKVDNPTGSPVEQGWYQDKYKTVTTYTYEKQEGGDGNGPYTYTIMAKDGDNYVDPFLKAVDKDGYTYNYYVEEGKVPDDYSASKKDLDVTNVNIKANSVIVTKEWKDGPAIEDVTLHLLRMLVPVTEMEDVDYGDLERLSETYPWKTVGLVYNAPRAPFVNEDGTPKLDPGSDDTSSQDYIEIEGFNKDLPMYVTLEEHDPTPTDPDRTKSVDYRAVYKLVEDETSDAYKTTYRTENTTEVEGVPKTTTPSNKYGYYLNPGDNPIVTNTVKATNKAYIAAVKQLLGRDWQSNDDFPFTLEPVGKGTYNEDGTFKEIDDSAEAKAIVPMPEKDDERHSTNTKYIKKDGTDPITAEAYDDLPLPEKRNYVVCESETHALPGDETVDKNGGLERLARFGAIEYKVSDLVHNTTDRHMQGDFFYQMKEKVPADAKMLDANGDETDTTYAQAVAAATSIDDLKGKKFKKDSITYDGTIHTVHVKVRENRTGKLQVQIAYDETTEGDITTGTQYTPVYTNKVDAVMEITGTKVWVDGQEHNNNEDLKNKLIVHYNLYDPESGDKVKDGTVDNPHIDWDGDKYTVINLPKTDEDGNLYEYYVTESAIAGYTTTYMTEDPNNPETRYVERTVAAAKAALEDDDSLVFYTSDDGTDEEADLGSMENTDSVYLKVAKAEEDSRDAAYDGGAIVNTAKVGDVVIVKRFEDEKGNEIEKDLLPDDFTITVKYTTLEEDAKTGIWKTVVKEAPLTIGQDQTSEDSGDYEGFYKWTVTNVVNNTKLTAEESGFDSPDGYQYDETVTNVNGKKADKHTNLQPLYAELIMPRDAAGRDRSAVTEDDPDDQITNPYIKYVNKYVKAVGDLRLIKKWDDESDRDGKRPNKVTFKVTAQNYKVDGWTGEGDNSYKEFEIYMPTELSDEWSLVVEDLPVYHADGNKISYTVNETTVPTGYDRRGDGDSNTLTAGEITDAKNISNFHDIDTDDLKVTKLWDDAGNAEGLRPDDATVHLYKIAITDEILEEVFYLVDPAGFDTNPKDGVLDDAEFADYKAEYQDVFEATIADLVDEVKADPAKAIQAGVIVKVIEPTNAEKPTDVWSTGATWTDLPVYENGIKITYFVIEQSINGYTATYQADTTKDYSATNNMLELDGWKDKDDEQSTDDDPQVIDIKNSRTPDTDTVKATKVWDDQSNVDGKRPTSVEFELYELVWNEQNKKYEGPRKVTKRPATQADVDAAKVVDPQSTKKIGDDITVTTLVLDGTKATAAEENLVANETEPTNANTWNGEWINLPRTKNGKTVIYSVKEKTDPVNSYYRNAVVTGDQANGFTVTNTYEPFTGEVLVDKVWDDENNKAGKRTGTAPQVKLQYTTKDPSDAGFNPATDWLDVTEAVAKDVPMDHSDKITLTEKQTYTWKDLPAYKLENTAATGLDPVYERQASSMATKILHMM